MKMFHLLLPPSLLQFTFRLFDPIGAILEITTQRINAEHFIYQISLEFLIKIIILSITK